MCIGTKRRKSYTEEKGSKAPHFVYMDRTYFIVLTYLCVYTYCLTGGWEDKEPKNPGSRRLSQTESQQQKGKDSSIFTPGRRKYITLSLEHTSPSPGKANTLGYSVLFSVLFLLSPRSSRIQPWNTLQHQSLHVRTEWALPPNLTFSNIGMVNASIYITVKLHQNSFLKLSLEMPNCRCLYHTYFRYKRCSKQFNCCNIHVIFISKLWTELYYSTVKLLQGLLFIPTALNLFQKFSQEIKGIQSCFSTEGIKINPAIGLTKAIYFFFDHILKLKAW